MFVWRIFSTAFSERVPGPTQASRSQDLFLRGRGDPANVPRVCRQKEARETDWCCRAHTEVLQGISGTRTVSYTFIVLLHDKYRFQLSCRIIFVASTCLGPAF